VGRDETIGGRTDDGGEWKGSDEFVELVLAMLGEGCGRVHVGLDDRHQEIYAVGSGLMTPLVRFICGSGLQPAARSERTVCNTSTERTAARRPGNAWEPGSSSPD
jgi:hypothetical protein